MTQKKIGKQILSIDCENPSSQLLWQAQSYPSPNHKPEPSRVGKNKWRRALHNASSSTSWMHAVISQSIIHAW
jgi:hypothetical protein